MRNVRPDAFSLLVPPDPPAIADPAGGASGITAITSTPSTIVIFISLGKGTGARLALSITQFNDILHRRRGCWELGGDGGVVSRVCPDQCHKAGLLGAAAIAGSASLA